MTTFYIYEVPGVKNGATNQWDKRSQQNFNAYGIMPVIVETMEGPNEPEFWQVVGDREWELADQNGYPKGTHYRVAKELRRRQGLVNVESGHMDRMRSSAHTPEAKAKQRRTWKENNNKVKFTNEHRREVNRKYRKLTFEQAQEIRAKYVPREYTAKMLAEEYGGVSISAIKCILQGITYKQP